MAGVAMVPGSDASACGPPHPGDAGALAPAFGSSGGRTTRRER
jgi:hypothetical protein